MAVASMGGRVSVKLQGSGLVKGIMSLVFEMGDIALGRSLYLRVLFGHRWTQIACR